MRRETMALLGTLFAAALLAGCGGGGGNQADAAPSPTAPGPVPAPQAGALRDCVNPDLHKVGTVYRAVWRTSGAVNGESLEEYAVLREAAFNGHAGLVEIELKKTITETGLPARSGVQYLYERLEEQAVIRYGMAIPVVLGQGLPDMVLTTVYDPPWREPTTLGVGESHAVEVHGTTTATGGPAGEPPVKESDSWTMTYLGQETIMVPAGTFTACKIRRHVAGSGWEAITWTAKGSGLNVRELHRDGGQEWLHELLPGATLNGQPIRIE